ncbi:sugar ABC transporter permease [Spirochaetia bacterium]|nr:sugar ABC transporter permease [Spirochaetia bacterium]
MGGIMKKEKRRFVLKEKHLGWIAAFVFILPLFTGVVVFVMIPIVQSLYYTFTNYNGMQTPSWVGMKNLIRITTDNEFKKEFFNTMKLVFISVPISIFLSLIMANLLNTKIIGRTVFRVIYFLPNVTMSTVVATMWLLVFNSQYGTVNTLLFKLFQIRPAWLTNPNLVMVVVIVVGVWGSLGYDIVILLAALQNVPTNYYEACEIDGGNQLHKFFHITIPMVSPSLFFLLITGVIGAFNSFDLVFMFAQSSGPIRDALRTMVFGIYESGVVKFEMGYASAKAVILFVIILMVTLAQFYGQKKWVHYQ